MSDFCQKCFDAMNIDKFIALPHNWLKIGYKGKFDDTEEFKQYIDDYKNGKDVNVIVGYRTAGEGSCPMKYKLMSYKEIEEKVNSYYNINDEGNQDEHSEVKS